MILWPVTFVFLAVLSTSASQIQSRVWRDEQDILRSQKLSHRVEIEKRSAPSGSFLDKLERVKSFQDLYREFRVPKSQQIPKIPLPLVKVLRKPHGLWDDKSKHVPGQKQNEVLVEPEVDVSQEATYCQTKKICVNVPQPRDKSGMHWPFCAAVQQCSGCCSILSALQKCAAVKTSTRPVNVYYLPFDGSIPVRRTQVDITIHHRCECKCRQSASSCNSRQVFVAKHCRCECNPGINKRCPLRFKWDESLCACVCAHPSRQCPSNQEFSREICGCVCKTKSCRAGMQLNRQTKGSKLISAEDDQLFRWGG